MLNNSEDDNEKIGFFQVDLDIDAGLDVRERCAAIKAWVSYKHSKRSMRWYDGHHLGKTGRKRIRLHLPFCISSRLPSDASLYLALYTMVKGVSPDESQYGYMLQGVACVSLAHLMPWLVIENNNAIKRPFDDNNKKRQCGSKQADHQESSVRVSFVSHCAKGERWLSNGEIPRRGKVHARILQRQVLKSNEEGGLDEREITREEEEGACTSIDKNAFHCEQDTNRSRLLFLEPSVLSIKQGPCHPDKTTIEIASRQYADSEKRVLKGMVLSRREASRASCQTFICDAGFVLPSVCFFSRDSLVGDGVSDEEACGGARVCEAWLSDCLDQVVRECINEKSFPEPLMDSNHSLDPWFFDQSRKQRNGGGDRSKDRLYKTLAQSGRGAYGPFAFRSFMGIVGRLVTALSAACVYHTDAMVYKGSLQEIECFGDAAFTGCGDCEDFAHVMARTVLMLRYHADDFANEALRVIGQVLRDLYLAAGMLCTSKSEALHKTSAFGKNGRTKDEQASKIHSKQDDEMGEDSGAHMMLVLLPIDLMVSMARRSNNPSLIQRLKRIRKERSCKALQWAMDEDFRDAFRNAQNRPLPWDKPVIMCEGTSYADPLFLPVEFDALALLNRLACRPGTNGESIERLKRMAHQTCDANQRDQRFKLFQAHLKLDDCLSNVMARSCIQIRRRPLWIVSNLFWNQLKKQQRIIIENERSSLIQEAKAIASTPKKEDLLDMRKKKAFVLKRRPIEWYRCATELFLVGEERGPSVTKLFLAYTNNDGGGGGPYGGGGGGGMRRFERGVDIAHLLTGHPLISFVQAPCIKASLMDRIGDALLHASPPSYVVSFQQWKDLRSENEGDPSESIPFPIRKQLKRLNDLLRKKGIAVPLSCSKESLPAAFIKRDEADRKRSVIAFDVTCPAVDVVDWNEEAASSSSTNQAIESFHLTNKAVELVSSLSNLDGIQSARFSFRCIAPSVPEFLLEVSMATSHS